MVDNQKKTVKLVNSVVSEVIPNLEPVKISNVKIKNFKYKKGAKKKYCLN